VNAYSLRVAVDSVRISRLLDVLVSASNGDYDARVPLEEIDDALLEVEVGVNYLLDELALRHQQNEVQAAQIAAQTTALVEALSTPIIVVWPGVLALPLIGRLDVARATNISSTLLDRVVSDRASHVILDLTGVETIEASTIAALLRMVRAIGLLGAKCIITGLQPNGARQVVELGTDISQLRTVARMSDALARVLAEKQVLR
jgi:rsbT co-antagonist protein RsbR